MEVRLLMKMTQFSIAALGILCIVAVQDYCEEQFLKAQYKTTYQYNQILDTVCSDALYEGIVGDNYGEPVIDRNRVKEAFYEKLYQAFLTEGTEAEQERLSDSVLALCFVGNDSYCFYTKEAGFGREYKTEQGKLVDDVGRAFEEVLKTDSRGKELGVSYTLYFPSIEGEEAYQTIMPNSLLCVFETSPMYPDKKRFWRVIMSGSTVRKVEYDDGF